MEQPSTSTGAAGFGTVLKEVGTSLRDLVQSEMDLVMTEVKDSTRKLSRHTGQLAIFGALLAISVFPFLAFVIIALGRALDGRYSLSSLIVAIICAAVGGIFASRAYKKLQEEDLTLPVTRRNFEREKEAVNEKVEDLKDATRRRAS